MTNDSVSIIFSQRAYNAIISEAVDKDPLETGGILLGHILDNGFWIVLEVIPPGAKSIMRPAFFEYDASYINYTGNIIAKQYKIGLRQLGLWHRHPGMMNTFSYTDDETNFIFASENTYGAISGLVNFVPEFHLTMYHVTAETTAQEQSTQTRRSDYYLMERPIRRTANSVSYKMIESIIVDDTLIPSQYLEFKYGVFPAVIQKTTSQQANTASQENELETQYKSPNCVSSTRTSSDGTDNPDSKSSLASNSTRLNEQDQNYRYSFWMLILCLSTKIYG